MIRAGQTRIERQSLGWRRRRGQHGGINMLWRQHQPHHPYPHRSSCHRCCREKRFACNPGKNTNWISLAQSVIVDVVVYVVVPQYFGLMDMKGGRGSIQNVRIPLWVKSKPSSWQNRFSVFGKRTVSNWGEIFTSEFHFVCAKSRIVGNFQSHLFLGHVSCRS